MFPLLSMYLSNFTYIDFHWIMKIIIFIISANRNLIYSTERGLSVGAGVWRFGDVVCLACWSCSLRKLVRREGSASVWKLLVIFSWVDCSLIWLSTFYRCKCDWNQDTCRSAGFPEDPEMGSCVVSSWVQCLEQSKKPKDPEQQNLLPRGITTLSTGSCALQTSIPNQGARDRRHNHTSVFCKRERNSELAHLA